MKSFYTTQITLRKHVWIVWNGSLKYIKQNGEKVTSKHKCSNELNEKSENKSISNFVKGTTFVEPSKFN